MKFEKKKFGKPFIKLSDFVPSYLKIILQNSKEKQLGKLKFFKPGSRCKKILMALTLLNFLRLVKCFLMFPVLAYSADLSQEVGLFN